MAENGNGNGNKLYIKTPFGELGATGQFVVHVVLMCGLTAALGYGMKDIRDTVKAQIVESASHLTKQIVERGDQTDDSREANVRRIARSLEYNSVLLRSVCRNLVAAQYQYQCDPSYFGFDEKTMTKEGKSK